MAAETETSEGVVFKSEDDAILLKDAKGEPWKSYLKYGRNYDSYKPPVGQKVRVHYRAWENPTTSKVSYYLNEVEVLGPPPETAPAPSPGPAPAVAYQATHDAAKERAGQESPGSDHGTFAQYAEREAAPLQQSGSGAVPTAAFPDGTVGIPSPLPGEYAFRDLSIQRQNRLNVSVQALVANLEQCPPEDKPNRMITPWGIAEFERMLVEGAVYDDGTGPDYQPPPEDLPG